ncbi:MAG TPA: transaldolase family protein [bacterium]|nr:transaldolase family protein [bacterium]HOL47609.1 transaldolase family protein [bacterium]HPQ19409.1 transaldolase family protein [bacterium]
MKIFIDSSNIEEIKQFKDFAFFAGITTNPTFFIREKISDMNGAIKEMNKIIKGEMHIEAMGDTAEEIIKNAIENTKLADDVVAKIPMTPEGIKAVEYLSKKNYKTNVHLIFSSNQAILAALAGATYVCPLIGRLYDHGHNGLEIIQQILQAFKNYNYINTKVMISSVRSAEHCRMAAILGADAITVPPAIIKQMFRHPLTDIGIDIFKQDMINLTIVEKIMHRGNKLPLIKEGTYLKEAIKIITEKNFGTGIIVDNENNLKGIITDGDLRRIFQKYEDISNLKVEEVMSKNPRTIMKTELIGNALKKMEDNKITSLIIADENKKVIGFIHIHDILGKQVREY